MRVNWEFLMEPPACVIFNSHCENFSHVRRAIEDIELECAMFRASIADAAFRSCGLKLIGTCHGVNQRIHWWTSVLMKVIKPKKVALGLAFMKDT